MLTDVDTASSTTKRVGKVIFLSNLGINFSINFALSFEFKSVSFQCQSSSYKIGNPGAETNCT